MHQVTIRATEAKATASRVRPSKAREKISRMGFEGAFFIAAFHCSDSGTNTMMSKASKAGTAPTSITQRQESRVTANDMPTMAIKA